MLPPTSDFLEATPENSSETFMGAPRFEPVMAGQGEQPECYLCALPSPKQSVTHGTVQKMIISFWHIKLIQREEVAKEAFFRHHPS